MFLVKEQLTKYINDVLLDYVSSEGDSKYPIDKYTFIILEIGYFIRFTVQDFNLDKLEVIPIYILQLCISY